MAGHGHQLRIAPTSVLFASLLVCLPALLGQGCPQGCAGIDPIEAGFPIPDADGNSTVAGGSTTTGNIAPQLTFTAPLQDISAEVGERVIVSWTDTDPDSNASITILVDPDRIFGNLNEIVVLTGRVEDDDASGDSFQLDTGSLQPATYRIVARISDGVNAEVLSTAPGRLLLFGPGLRPGNISPTVRVPEPALNLGVSQGDVIDIEVCGRDLDDDGGNPPQTPDIVLLLDLDDDPTNDLDLTGPLAEQVLDQVCLAGFFPVEIPGALVIGCLKDNDCGQPTQVPATDAQGNPITDANGNPVLTTVFSPGQQFQLAIDVGVIPPRDSGDPYWIRATMWDHVNRPVHGYASGSLNITALGSGTIDLARVGRTVSGAKFYGFNAGDRAGFTGSDLGDVDGDDVHDLVIVSRFGRGYEAGNTGTAHIVMGLPSSQKFGGEIPLNAVGTVYRGSLLTMPLTTGTEGITSVARMADVTDDGLPDIFFGLPYVEALHDDTDDDPCDSEDVCYGGLLPNPLSTDDEDDEMSGFDYREGIIGDPPDTFICSNDLDLNHITPIDSGYAILVGSENNLSGEGIQSGVFGLNAMGQRKSGEVGARFRGAWYPFGHHDFTQTEQPTRLEPDSWFGATVATTPWITDPDPTLDPEFGDSLLISAPRANDGRGRIALIYPNDFVGALGWEGQSASIPVYDTGCPPGQVVWFPSDTSWIGAAFGDQLGYAKPAGDYNLDGNRDIVCGAPGADRNGVADGGIVYVMFGRPDRPGIGALLDLSKTNPPRMEIRGTTPNDRFGEMQTIVGDVNIDNLPDIGFASQYADGPGGVDAGTIGIIFGGRRLTGENFFTVSQVTTAQLPGVLFYGTQSGGHAGAVINNAGDFNGDSIDDLVITAPDEIRTVDGLPRRGVAYLIFGGPHLRNAQFTLDQVGTVALPGIVFVSPYVLGSAEEAPIDWIGPAGDINSDGFADLLIGVSEADFVNPLEPSQRRIDSGEMYLMYGSNTGNNVVR